MNTIRKLIFPISALLVLSSCSLNKGQPLLRLQIEEQAWNRRVQSYLTNQFPELFELPAWADYADSSHFRNRMRQGLAADGFDPETPVQFRWDGHWTNSRVTILTREESPRFRASVSNSVAAYFSNLNIGIPLSIAAP
jgi:hypothetical protein